MNESDRPLLPAARVHAAAARQMGRFHASVIAEVEEAAAANAVLVVGMRQNPFPRKARRLLDAAGIPYTYLEYGSYFSQWRRRLALKLWTGWPFFPMIFVHGTLIGGAAELQQLIDSAELRTMLEHGR